MSSVADTAHPDARRERPAVLGHRGALMYAPENTLPAFRMCLLAGADIELDVYPTRDGHLVVIHDSTVDRTTDGTGRVQDLTLAEIRALDAGGWFGPVFAGLRIPTFDDVLALVTEEERRPTTVAINLKPVTDAVIDGVVAAVRRHGMFDRTFVFDLSDENARRFKACEPRLRCAASALDRESIAKALTLDHIDVIWTNPKPQAVIEEVHRAGKRIYFTLVNSADQWLQVLAAGVDGMCTNHPLEMVRAAWPAPPEKLWDHYLSPDQKRQNQYRPPTP